ncbi:VOC family protein, partial [Propionicimonas sp.]|uniref:VOC family protein n=1 Tax=Propionicimonas sp. TaxID=1955623 RepID=UPI0039E695E6
MALVSVNCVTINAADPRRLAAFWAAIVGGVAQDAGNHFVRVEPGQGRVPLLFQRSEDAGPARGWVHLDCSVDDRDAAVAR